MCRTACDASKIAEMGSYDRIDFLNKFIDYMLSEREMKDTFIDDVYIQFFERYAHGNKPYYSAGLSSGALEHGSNALFQWKSDADQTPSPQAALHTSSTGEAGACRRSGRADEACSQRKAPASYGAGRRHVRHGKLTPAEAKLRGPARSTSTSSCSSGASAFNSKRTPCEGRARLTRGQILLQVGESASQTDPRA
eukprot:766751-Hanusia_phi.AAC.8